MLESELVRHMIEELRTLLSDLENGQEPSNGVLYEAVARLSSRDLEAQHGREERPSLSEINNS